MGLVVAVTGGIACGKSSVIGILKKAGFRVQMVDELVHQEMREGKAVYRDIMGCFGDVILDRRGRINRKKLGEIVFSDARARRKLEKIIQPVVIEKLKKIIESRYQRSDYAIEVPLLYEKGLAALFDKVLVVYCDKRLQEMRLSKIMGLSLAQARARIASQMDIRKKKRMADAVIKNNSTFKDLERAAMRALKNILT